MAGSGGSAGCVVICAHIQDGHIRRRHWNIRCCCWTVRNNKPDWPTTNKKMEWFFFSVRMGWKANYITIWWKIRVGEERSSVVATAIGCGAKRCQFLIDSRWPHSFSPCCFFFSFFFALFFSTAKEKYGMSFDPLFGQLFSGLVISRAITLDMKKTQQL